MNKIKKVEVREIRQDWSFEVTVFTTDGQKEEFRSMSFSDGYQHMKAFNLLAKTLQAGGLRVPEGTSKPYGGFHSFE